MPDGARSGAIIDADDDAGEDFGDKTGIMPVFIRQGRCAPVEKGCGGSDATKLDASVVIASHGQAVPCSCGAIE